MITNLLQAEGANVKNILPSEGATGWSDTWMLSSEAKNPNCMYLWMNHIVSPEANAPWPSTSARPRRTRRHAPSRRTRSTATYSTPDDEEFFDQIEYWKTPPKDCGDDRGEVCKTYDEWVQGWTEVKG